MKRLFILCVIFVSCVLLCACGTQRGLVVTPTNSPVPSITFTATVVPIRTSTPTRRPKATFTITATPMPTATAYPTKQVLLDYYLTGFHSAFFDMARNDNVSYSKLVVYSDGQIIIARENHYLQKQLSAHEMNQFFAQIKSLGFYALETDEQGRQTKNLYTPDNPFEKMVDGTSHCILTTKDPREICTYDPYTEFLVPQMKNILKFLEVYKPEGMTVYSPDRLLLAIESADNKDNFDQDYLPAASIPWPERFPPLQVKSPYFDVIYIDGKMAAEISAYLDSVRFDKSFLFRQNGKEYIVAMDIILPHESIDFSALQQP